jgi:hypothetical protein
VGIRIKLASRNNRGSRKAEDTSGDPEARDIQLTKQIQIKRRMWGLRVLYDYGSMTYKYEVD